MNIAASVIVCTHNPRPDFVRATLGALQAQTAPADQWELILVDNASTNSLSSDWDLRWQPNARIIREEELGLTSARLRGIRESEGELLIFVDDDNVLAGDYVAAALGLAASHAHIGAFGGSVKADFEVAPPEWAKPYLPGLAITEIDRDYWSNLPIWSKAVPFGAGLCVRRGVAEDYANKVVTDPRRKTLGRSGLSLGACEDTDLAWCAIDLGFGTARFRALKMTHLIPKVRLTENYITRLYAGFEASNVILSSIRDEAQRAPRSAFAEWRSLIWQLRRGPRIQRRILCAGFQSRREAYKLLAGLETLAGADHLARAQTSK